MKFITRLIAVKMSSMCKNIFPTPICRFKNNLMICSALKMSHLFLIMSNHLMIFMFFNKKIISFFLFLQINTNGILTFNIEFPDYINQPFPFEYPSIAGFYSNVDTTGSNDSTSISIFSSQDPEQLQKVSELVRYAYNEQRDFEATDIVVATWKNVGYFESKTDKLNTFQVD